jgi:hypothetical protein
VPKKFLTKVSEIRGFYPQFSKYAQKYIEKMLKNQGLMPVLITCPKMFGLCPRFSKCAQNFLKNFFKNLPDASIFQNLPKNF